MPNDNGKESFKGEKEWDRQNTAPGGGEIVRIKGMRVDDHSDKSKELRERRRQSEQKNNPGGHKR